MAGRLNGKICVITGTGGALGSATALRLASEGARIVGCDIKTDDAEQTVQAVRAAGGEMVSLHPTDLTDPAQCRAVIEFAVDQYGGVDVLINNAGKVARNPIEAMSDEDWNMTMDGELTQVFYVTRAAWPELRKRGGSVVNVASTSGWKANYVLTGALAHSATKAGVIGMTRNLAMEGREHGIRANSVSPGWFDTPKGRQYATDNPEWERKMNAKTMSGRPGTTREIANVILFLASDESSFVNAADIIVDGGGAAW